MLLFCSLSSLLLFLLVLVLVLVLVFLLLVLRRFTLLGYWAGSRGKSRGIPRNVLGMPRDPT